MKADEKRAPTTALFFYELLPLSPVRPHHPDEKHEGFGLYSRNPLQLYSNTLRFYS
ncbi:hypothetical protein [Capillibacterium thermochitinicola]|uniref:hypothetical protein n=1 Tax=Capillibacterium thermochitinicola TaxID=2699427 RepID=UPI001E502AAB|nr:hypothetical protein [Capillibacterium thermochitinicola]